MSFGFFFRRQRRLKVVPLSVSLSSVPVNKHRELKKIKVAIGFLSYHARLTKGKRNYSWSIDKVSYQGKNRLHDCVKPSSLSLVLRNVLTLFVFYVLRYFHFVMVTVTVLMYISHHFSICKQYNDV